METLQLSDTVAGVGFLEHKCLPLTVASSPSSLPTLWSPVGLAQTGVAILSPRIVRLVSTFKQLMPRKQRGMIFHLKRIKVFYKFHRRIGSTDFLTWRNEWGSARWAYSNPLESRGREIRSKWLIGGIAIYFSMDRLRNSTHTSPQ